MEVFFLILGVVIGVVLGRLWDTGSAQSSATPSVVPLDKLHRSQRVWFPYQGEWKPGWISGPKDPQRTVFYVQAGNHAYNVPVNREIEVAREHLRLWDDGPLYEPAPALTAEDLERERRGL